MQELKAGTTLQHEKYTIERTLGKGSFGITYMASYKTIVQGPLGKMEAKVNVAIKEFFMNELSTRGTDSTTVEGSSSAAFINYRKRFQREAENLSHLNHPNIVKVSDIFVENNTVYYVMQYIDGMSLDQYVLSKGHLDEKEAKDILEPLSSALMYMHSRKMLHLDLKPKNVMLDKNGHVYLIDFGLSKQFAADGEPESSTSIGLGTSGYAPLEQANYANDKSFQPTIDVYALGATTFKMLTGHRPDDASVILNQGFPRQDLEKVGVSTQTIDAIEKAMEPQRNKRYQMVNEFVSALTDGIGGNGLRTSDAKTVPPIDNGSADDESTEFTDNTIINNEQDTEIVEPDSEDEVYSDDEYSDNDDEIFGVSKKKIVIGVVAVGCIIMLAWFAFVKESHKTAKVSDATEMEDTVSADENNAPSDEKTTDLERAKTTAGEVVDKGNSNNQQSASSSNTNTSNVTTSEVTYSSEQNDEKEANRTNDHPSSNINYNVAEQMPSFKGNVNHWLAENLHYPTVAAENGVQGRVIVRFVVQKDGSISNVSVIRGVDPALDREAMRVVKAMPRWSPGWKDGEPVNVWFTLPITFSLQ